MTAEIETGGYTNVVAFLATAGVVVPLFNRLKISPILGFLAAGVALGPQGLGRFVSSHPWLDWITVSQPGQVSGLAEFGVVFLLFMIGLELSWERLRLLRRQVFGLGALQTLGCAALIALAGRVLGLDPLAATVIGAALAMSSTAVGIPVLGERARLLAPSGRASFSVLLFQDLAVAPILIALAFLGGDSATPHGPTLLSGLHPHPAVALVSAALGVLAIVVLGRLLLRPLFASAARAKNKEFFIAVSLLVVIGSALIAQYLGLSMALGAFLAGILLAETEYRHEVEVLISPFKELLLGLFFLSIGLSLNVALILEQPVLILGTAVGLIVVKTIACFWLCRLFGLKWRTAFEAALILSASGEFAFVILAQAGGGGVLSPDVAQAMVVAATLTMFVIPLLGMVGAHVATAGDPHGLAEGPQLKDAPEDEKPKVLIVGYGRVGRLVGEMLDRHEVEWIAIDRSPRSVREGREEGGEVYFGDASRPEFLERCGLRNARGVVLTTDEPEAAEAVAAAIRRVRPDVGLVARARDARHARRLYELGATNAVPETIEASLQLSEALLVDLGIPMGFVIASIHDKRAEIREGLTDARQGQGKVSPLVA